jgi:hypothetical protein
MKKIFISFVFIGVTILTQAQTKDTTFLQTKKEKTEVSAADQHRMQMEKEQLQAKPEMVNNEKLARKKTTKKDRCKVKSNKKS